MTSGKAVKQRWRTMHKKKDFNPLLFMVSNNLPLDKICGTFPIIFKDYRRLSHALRISWAFYLTMRMKKLSNEPFHQRRANKVFALKGKNHLTAIFTHIYSQLRRKNVQNEKDIIKCLKNSLCYHVSEAMDQEELPEGDHFNLVPFAMRPLIFDRLKKEKKINFFFPYYNQKSYVKRSQRISFLIH
jgi:hypothetical protein